MPEYTEKDAANDYGNTMLFGGALHVVTGIFLGFGMVCPPLFAAGLGWEGLSLAFLHGKDRKGILRETYDKWMEYKEPKKSVGNGACPAIV